MKYDESESKFNNKENLQNMDDMDNDSRLITHSEKGFTNLKNLLNYIKEGKISLVNTKDRLKNKKLVAHLREKMFKGFIKTKFLSERKKLKSAGNSGLCSRKNSAERVEHGLEENDVDIDELKKNKTESKNFFSQNKNFHKKPEQILPFFIKNYKNYQIHKIPNKLKDSIKFPDSQNPSKLFITDRHFERDHDLICSMKDDKILNIHQNEKEDFTEQRKNYHSLRKKIFNNSFEEKQYQRVNFIAFEIPGPIFQENKNLKKGKIKRDIIRQIESMDKICLSRLKENQADIYSQFQSDKNLYKLKEDQMDRHINKFASRNESALTRKNITIQNRNSWDNIDEDYTSNVSVMKQICQTPKSTKLNPFDKINQIPPLKLMNHEHRPEYKIDNNQNILSEYSFHIKPKNHFNTKKFSKSLFNNPLIREKIKSIDSSKNLKQSCKNFPITNHLQNEKSNKKNERNIVDKYFIENQRFLNTRNKHRKLIDSKMTQTDFKSLMNDRKEKFKRFKESVFDFSKVPILLETHATSSITFRNSNKTVLRIKHQIPMNAQ